MASLMQRMRAPDRTAERSSLYDLGVANPFYGTPMVGTAPVTTMAGSKAPAIDHNLTAYIEHIHKRHGIVAASVWVRQLVVSQLRFVWLTLHGDEKGTTEWRPSLEVLHRPNPAVTRPQMLATVELDASYAGNAFQRRLRNGRGLVRMRPDWVDLALYSEEAQTPADVWVAGDTQLVGYVYWPAGRRGPDGGGVPLSLDEVWHFAPEPDGTSVGRGISWVTSVMREVAADSQASDYLQKFFENAATANMVVKTPPEVQEPEQFEEWVDVFEKGHVGVANAWRNVYLTAGSDVQVVGSTLTDLGLRDFQGGLETRVATRSRVPASLLGIREGLQGSALNQGNFEAAKRTLSDTFFAPYAEMLCASAERVLTDRQPGEELSYDEDAVTFLRADVQAQSTLTKDRSQAVETLYRAGFDPDAIVEAITTQDLRKLRGQHSGIPTVQAQKAAALTAPAAPAVEDA